MGSYTLSMTCLVKGLTKLYEVSPLGRESIIRRGYAKLLETTYMKLRPTGRLGLYEGRVTERMCCGGRGIRI